MAAISSQLEVLGSMQEKIDWAKTLDHPTLSKCMTLWMTFGNRCQVLMLVDIDMQAVVWMIFSMSSADRTSISNG